LLLRRPLSPRPLPVSSSPVRKQRCESGAEPHGRHSNSEVKMLLSTRRTSRRERKEKPRKAA
jgi:hypothetical protein